MKTKMKTLIAAVLAICMMLCFVGCGEKPEEEDKIPVTEKTYYTVTTVNGTIGTDGVNRERFEAGESVTVNADASADIEQDFTGWSDGASVLSTSASYTFTASKDVTLTAQYGSNYSVWDGTYPESAPETYIENDETKTIRINSAAALAYWANKVSASAEGTDKTNYKYSKFHFGQYINDTQGAPSEDQKKTARENATFTDNVWTVSIEANIDLANKPWSPIIDAGYILHGTIIEGNNRIIKNLYNIAIDSGSLVNTNALVVSAMKSAGFIANIVGSDLTIQNLVFDSAVTEVINAANNFQNIGTIIGYAHGGNIYEYTGKHQTIVFDNVSVVNSSMIASALTRKVGMLIGTAGCADINTEYNKTVIKNCIVANNYITGCDYLGALIGHIYSPDENLTVKDRTIVEFYNNVIENITAVNTYAGSATVPTFKFGTLGTWNFRNFSASPITNTYSAISVDAGNPTIKLIDLHCGQGAAGAVTSGHSTKDAATYSFANTNTYLLTRTLINGTAKNIFIINDISYDEDSLYQLETEEYEAPSDLVVYLVAGKTLSGLDDYNLTYRYISGQRNDKGDLIVTDADGIEIGAWRITGFTGAYVAND